VAHLLLLDTVLAIERSTMAASAEISVAAETSAPVIVLTGASSGIGRATAWALAEQQARLILAARDRYALELVASECHRIGAPAEVITTDVTDSHSVNALAQAAIDRFGHIDVWINNVGVGVVGPYDVAPIEAHRRVIESNLIGHMNGAHAALRHFRQRGRGTLINMISLGGWWATPYAAAYSASKFGLRGFGQSLRAELTDMPHIHVCDVYPSLVDTPGVSHGANYTGRQLKPLPPLLDPREVAAKIVTLLDHPRPTTTVGSLARAARYSQVLAPEVRGKAVRRFLDLALTRANSVPQSEGNLFKPSPNHDVDGGYRRRSPTAMLIGMASVGLAALLWLGVRTRRA
jgi:short-subunit dehydrogenase